MTTREAQNKEIVRNFYKAFEANDAAALRATLSPELVAYSHANPEPQNLDTHIEGIQAWNRAFAATRFTIEEQIAEQDKVATRVAMAATHSGGAFQGLAPTGRQIAISGISIERILDGKIVERRVNSDWWSMMQQLGLVLASVNG